MFSRKYIMDPSFEKIFAFFMSLRYEVIAVCSYKKMRTYISFTVFFKFGTVNHLKLLKGIELYHILLLHSLYACLNHFILVFVSCKRCSTCVLFLLVVSQNLADDFKSAWDVWVEKLLFLSHTLQKVLKLGFWGWWRNLFFELLKIIVGSREIFWVWHNVGVLAFKHRLRFVEDFFFSQFRWGQRAKLSPIRAGHLRFRFLNAEFLLDDRGVIVVALDLCHFLLIIMNRVNQRAADLHLVNGASVQAFEVFWWECFLPLILAEIFKLNILSSTTATAICRT